MALGGVVFSVIFTNSMSDFRFVKSEHQQTSFLSLWFLDRALATFLVYTGLKMVSELLYQGHLYLPGPPFST